MKGLCQRHDLYVWLLILLIFQRGEKKKLALRENGMLFSCFIVKAWQRCQVAAAHLDLN
jgi:hypothetical protein